jgi:hypothetical protein
MVFLAGLPVWATVTPFANLVSPIQAKIVTTNAPDEAMKMRESLSRDVARHPNDFVVFVTEMGAEEFVAEHQVDAKRETDRRIVSRGVVGYWQGKTIVVLPWEPLKGGQ